MSRHHNDTTFEEAAQWALKNLDENGKVKERSDRSWSNMTILCIVVGVIFVLLFIWWMVSIWTSKKKKSQKDDGTDDSNDDDGSGDDSGDDDDDNNNTEVDNTIVQT